MKDRKKRLDPLLQEVISEVIHKDVRNPHVSSFTTVSRVDISRDLHHAKVFVSIIGTHEEKTTTITALQSAAPFIAVKASKKVVMRYFPNLTFYLDSSADKQFHIDALLKTITYHTKPNSEHATSSE